MPGFRGFACGVAKEYCNGTSFSMSKSIENAIKKFHRSPVEAFNCHRADLLRQGYTQVGPREFSPPDGGPIRVLTKKSRFGGLLRGGKRGEANSGGPPTRMMPLKRFGGIIGSF